MAEHWFPSVAGTGAHILPASAKYHGELKGLWTGYCKGKLEEVVLGLGESSPESMPSGDQCPGCTHGKATDARLKVRLQKTAELVTNTVQPE